MSDELSCFCHAVNFLGVIWQPYRAYYINKCIRRAPCSYPSIWWANRNIHHCPCWNTCSCCPAVPAAWRMRKQEGKASSDFLTTLCGRHFSRYMELQHTLSETWHIFANFACFFSLPHRKKVLDFYQRACLSGYCSAFAYKPMHCALSSQLNGKCIELVQVLGQSAIFTCCDLPGTTPIKQSSRRNSWSSDGMCVFSPACNQICCWPRGWIWSV